MGKRWVRRVIYAAALALAGPVQAVAALEGNPVTFCRGGMFGGPCSEAPDVRLGRVTAGKPAVLLNDMDGCPVSGRNCGKSAIYGPPALLRPGAVVVVLPSALPGFACVLNAAHRDNNGWLPQARVDGVPVDPDPPLAAWAGTWRRSLGDDFFVLKAGRDASLSVYGEAFWPGRNVFPYHSGDLFSAARPEGDRVTFAEGEDKGQPICVAKLELLGHGLLAVNDNGRCGGYNVSFGGIYKRASRP